MHLDLSGNLLSSSAIESGSISQLKKLRKLVIGEHNYAGKGLLAEIEGIRGLEVSNLKIKALIW